MEYLGVFDIINVIYFFILYLIFILWINKVMVEFMEVFNNYKVYMESNLILNEM